MDEEPTLISINGVCELTSLSRTMINRYRAEGRFCAAVPLGDRRIAFVRSEVLTWIQERIERRDATFADNDNGRRAA
jgi:prophage regulatory protein